MSYEHTKLEVVEFFMKGFLRAVDYSNENNTFRPPITISRDCFEARADTPLDTLYVFVERVKDDPAPNLMLIEAPSDTQKQEIWDAQISFRKWWSETLGYAMDHDVPMTVHKCDDNKVDFSVEDRDSIVLHLVMRKEPRKVV